MWRKDEDKKLRTSFLHQKTLLFQFNTLTKLMKRNIQNLIYNKGLVIKNKTNMTHTRVMFVYIFYKNYSGLFGMLGFIEKPGSKPL